MSDREEAIGEGGSAFGLEHGVVVCALLRAAGPEKDAEVFGVVFFGAGGRQGSVDRFVNESFHVEGDVLGIEER